MASHKRKGLGARPGTLTWDIDWSADGARLRITRQRRTEIDWRSVTVFHLDEYVGLPASHPARFRRCLRERFLESLVSAPDLVAIEGAVADLDADDPYIMSVRQIMRAECIVLSLSDARKAQAVRAAIEGPVSPEYPASRPQRHASALLFLDPRSASRLLTASTPA